MKEPIVHKLKRYLRDQQIPHVQIAEKTQRHRTFITRKLNGDSMETSLLEQIMEAAGIWYEDLICVEGQGTADLEQQVRLLREEVNVIKEALPIYQTKSST